MTTDPTTTRRGALALAGALTLGGCSSLATSGCSLEPAESIDSGWPMARRDPSRAAAAPAASAPDPDADLVEQWTYQSPRGVRVPVVSDGVAYTVANDPDPADSGDAEPPTVSALDVTDGTVRWDAALDEATFRMPGVSGLAVAGETVYLTAGPGWPGTDDVDAHLYALDAATGAVRWTYARPQLASASLVARGLVVLRHDGGLLAVEAATGEVCWRYAPRGNFLQRQFSGAAVPSSPALADGTLYARVYDSDARPNDRCYRLDAIDAASGTRQWRTDWFEVDNPGPSPVVADDVVVFTTDSVVRGFDPASGEQQWRVQLFDSLYYPGIWISAVAAARGTICVRLVGGTGERTSGYYAIDRERDDVRWHRPGLRESPIIAGETVYGINIEATDGDGTRVPRLRGVDLETGEVRTTLRVDPNNELRVTPTVAEGRLFLATSRRDGESTDSETARIHAFA